MKKNTYCLPQTKNDLIKALSEKMLLSDDTIFVNEQLFFEAFYSLSNVSPSVMADQYLSLKSKEEETLAEIKRNEDELITLDKNSELHEKKLLRLNNHNQLLEVYRKKKLEFKLHVLESYSWILVEEPITSELTEVREPVIIYGFSNWWAVPKEDPEYKYRVLKKIVFSC